MSFILIWINFIKVVNNLFSIIIINLKAGKLENILDVVLVALNISFDFNYK